MASGNRRKRRAEYPELRDFFLKKMGYYELAQEIGYHNLPSRVVGTLGGLTTKYFAALGEKGLVEGDLEKVYNSINESAKHTLEEFSQNPNKLNDINPLLSLMDEQIPMK